MQIKAPLFLLAALISTAAARLEGQARRSANPVEVNEEISKRDTGGASWTQTPSGQGSTEGFGARTSGGGSGIFYSGNVGNPWGSNIIQVSASDAPKYDYVMQFQGSNKEPWTLVFWNKIGPDGKMDGWYGHSALTLQLGPGETKYVAVDQDSRGGFAAAPGNIPTDQNGGYASTWGEFDFGSTSNGGWSGYDVSMIQAQNAGLQIQGMKMCQAPGDKDCSSITSGGSQVVNAYTSAQAAAGGIGGNIPGGPVRLAVTIDYNGWVGMVFFFCRL